MATTKKSTKASPKKPAPKLPTRVRARIKQLVAPGPPTHGGEDPYRVLHRAIIGQGTWSDVSAGTVALLLDSVAKARDPVPLIMLAGGVLGADQIRGWLAPPIAPEDANERAAHEAAVARKEVLLSGLASEVSLVRSASAMSLAMVPALAAVALPVLVKLAGEDPDELARASAVLAIGRLGISDPAAAEAIESARRASESALVRGAAGMAWLRQDETRPFEHAHAELRCWLGHVATVPLPWFDTHYWFLSLGFPDALARSLLALGRARGPAGVEALLDTLATLASIEDGPVEAQLAKIALELGGFAAYPPPPSVTPIDELTSVQKLVATRLARTHLLPAGGHGLPGSGAVRRRWLGIEPPGPLDRLVKAADGSTAPLWRAWQKRLPEPGDFASPIDRFQAVVEYASGSYPPFFRSPKQDELEGEITATQVNDELVARAERMGDDLAARFAAARRTKMIAPFTLAFSALFLSPLVRAGRAVPEKWDVLVYVGTEPRSHELLSALPPERRERALLAYLDSGSPVTWGGQAGVVLSLVDLAPTRRVGDALRKTIAVIAERPGAEEGATQLRTALAEATKRYPALDAPKTTAR